MATTYDDNYQMQRGGVLVNTVYQKSFIAVAVSCALGITTHAATLNTLAPASWQLPVGHYENAVIPLEIINPQAGLITGTTALSPYYRCYPGIPWRLPVSVLGGAPPFHYALTTNSGATIGQNYGDAHYGELYWANPVAGSYSFSVTVTDQQLNTYTVSWTLTVTTNMAVFVNAASGLDTNTGGYADPFQTIQNGWYKNSKTDSTYNGYHVYYFTGTYYTAAVGASYMDFAVKPLVHIGIDGQSVIFDYTACCAITGQRTDFLLSNISHKNTCDPANVSDYTQKAWTIACSRAVIHNNTFSSQLAAGVDGHNPCWIFMPNNAGGGTSHQYISFHNNDVSGLNNYMLAELYDNNSVVSENNTIHDDLGGTTRLIYYKIDNYTASNRYNTGIVNTNAHLCDLDAYGVLHDIEFCYNNWRVVGANYYGFVGLDTHVLGNIWFYRNTLTNGYLYLVNSSGGTVYLYKNVRQTTAATNGVDAATAGFTYSILDTLVNTSGLVDAITNELTPAYITSVGLEGHKIA